VAALSGASFATSGSAADLARLDLGDGVSLGFGIESASNVAVVSREGAAAYQGVRVSSDVVLSATTLGMKTEVVLRSADAPSSWVFPLRTLGVTPAWDEASGSVTMTDRRGNLVAVIPPGFMFDSSFDQRTGAPATSSGVRYALEQREGGWVLRMDLDAAWLADPARVWPVTVDPDITVTNAEQDDTFVSTRDFANQNNSSRSDLLVGTYDWGGEVSESFLHFDTAVAGLSDRVVTAASLSAYNYWSYSCTPAPVWLHAVAQPWVGWSTTSWPGPAFYGTALDVRSFANGYTGCACVPQLSGVLGT
jgi:hypothetical protein